MNEWPSAFSAFLAENDIDPEVYQGQSCFRHVFLFAALLGDVQETIPEAQPHPFLKDFVSVPAAQELASSSLFKDGQILPMEPCSALAVLNLELTPAAHVLDLCCAPGTKLALISKLGAASITGVDIARHRLSAAVSVAKRFHLPRLRLFLADGRAFNCGPHLIESPTSNAAPYRELYPTGGPRPHYCSTAVKRFPGRIFSLYDRVLVDAQCTHDGSIKHVRKMMAASWSDFDSHHYSNDGLKELYTLQLGLLENGFALLRPGGILVYSTCSMSKYQGEHIVDQFMDLHRHDATIERPNCPDGWPSIVQSDHCSLRLKPSDLSGGGFFIAKIRKTHNNQDK